MQFDMFAATRRAYLADEENSALSVCVCLFHSHTSTRHAHTDGHFQLFERVQMPTKSVQNRQKFILRRHRIKWISLSPCEFIVRVKQNNNEKNLLMRHFFCSALYVECCTGFFSCIFFMNITQTSLQWFCSYEKNRKYMNYLIHSLFLRYFVCRLFVSRLLRSQ